MAARHACLYVRVASLLGTVYMCVYQPVCGLFFAVFFFRVMDVIMSDKMDQALLKAAVGLLKRCELKLLQMHDMEDALHLLKLELPGVALCICVWAALHAALCCAGCVLQRTLTERQAGGNLAAGGGMHWGC